MQVENAVGAADCTGDVEDGTRLRMMAVYCVQMAMRCLMAAEQLSSEADRMRMIEIADRWSDLGKQAESRRNSDATRQPSLDAAG